MCSRTPTAGVFSHKRMTLTLNGYFWMLIYFIVSVFEHPSITAGSRGFSVSGGEKIVSNICFVSSNRLGE